MRSKEGIVFFFCVLATGCGSATIQTTPNLTEEARSLFANLVEASPRVREQNILLVIADAKEEKEVAVKNQHAMDCEQDQIFEKTIVLTKRQLDRFQKILSFMIAHKIAHVMFSALGLKVDHDTSELWADRLGFQLTTRIGKNPQKTIETVCEFFLKNDQENPNGKIRCELLQQLFHLHLYDDPSLL